VTTTAPDPWADAWQVATQPTLDPRLTGRRRRIWVRRVVGLVAIGVVLVVGTDLAFRGLDDSYGSLWPSSTPQLVVGIGLVVAGLALMIAGAARSIAKDLDRSFVGLDAYLPRSGRAWAAADRCRSSRRTGA